MNHESCSGRRYFIDVLKLWTFLPLNVFWYFYNKKSFITSFDCMKPCFCFKLFLFLFSFQFAPYLVETHNSSSGYHISHPCNRRHGSCKRAITGSYFQADNVFNSHIFYQCCGFPQTYIFALCHQIHLQFDVIFVKIN